MIKILMYEVIAICLLPIFSAKLIYELTENKWLGATVGIIMVIFGIILICLPQKYLKVKK